MVLQEAKSPVEQAQDIDRALRGVQATLDNVQHTNRDLVALTVEVETLQESIRDVVSIPEAEARRRSLAVAFGVVTFSSIQLADEHIEVCRVDPLVNRFRTGGRLSHPTETFCDVSFPLHNHDGFAHIGGSLAGANYVGILIYASIALAGLLWWRNARVTARKAKLKQRERNALSRQATKAIYDGKPHQETTRVARPEPPVE